MDEIEIFGGTVFQFEHNVTKAAHDDDGEQDSRIELMINFAGPFLRHQLCYKNFACSILNPVFYVKYIITRYN